MDDKITITKKEYVKLCDDADLLRVLQNAGVDNWNGYEIAMDMLDNGE